MVPVTVKGSRALWSPGGLDIRPGVVEVVFSDPVQLAPHLNKKAAREDLLTRVRTAIAVQLQDESPAASAALTPIAVQPSTAAISERPSS